MRRITTALLFAAVAGSTQADTVSTQVDFSIDGFFGGNIAFDRFDDMNGTRELTGVSFSYDQTMSFDLTIESNGYTALNSGDWLLDAGYYTIHQLGTLDGLGGDGGPSIPSIGAGGVFGLGITGDLGASDGYNQSGPDTQYTTISEAFTFNQAFDNSDNFGQSILDTVTGSGQLNTFMGGISELLFEWVNDPNWVVDPNNPPDGPFDGPFIDPYYGIFVNFDQISHFGTLTVTYEYAAVPAPSTLLALGGFELVGLRRRR